MRKFSSYGPIITDLHYYAPRTALIDEVCAQLIGEERSVGGHYITVWAPRQAGKTWLMQQVVAKLEEQGDFVVTITTMQSAKAVNASEEALEVLVTNLRNRLNVGLPLVTSWQALRTLFTSTYFAKPVILILDEFDALSPPLLNQFANEFRSIYTERLNEFHKASHEKTYLLHGLSLIGVRSVLGIENVTGSPFNVQRSVRIPNLTFAEVAGMFHWYEQESGQSIDTDVIDRIFYEMQGQPGLTCWLGELLTESYNTDPTQPLTLDYFEKVYAEALNVLPNNNILNIVSKAKQEPYKGYVLRLFETDRKRRFTYDDPETNFLYQNGVIDIERGEGEALVKFASPFVQKRLFNYFANDLFAEVGQLYKPFEDLTDTITDTSLHITNLMRRYEVYLRQNKKWLLQSAPRCADLRIFEAVYHFSLYAYLTNFLRPRRGLVYPEFPTGNGKIDLIIEYAGRVYGLELKSFTDLYTYRESLQKAAYYAQQLQVPEITLVLFLESINEENRRTYEVAYVDAITGITVNPVFITTDE